MTGLVQYLLHLNILLRIILSHEKTYSPVAERFEIRLLQYLAVGMAGATHNPVSFGAFAHSMLNGNLDEVNRYYDDDGQEVDLTDTFAGDDQSEAGSVDNETLFDTESEGCDDTSDYQDGGKHSSFNRTKTLFS